MTEATVTCFYPDGASQVAFVLREWSFILSVAFFGITLFHKQWVTFFYSYWLNLGIVLCASFARLWHVEVEDPYCHNYMWEVFPSTLCFTLGAIAGFAFWYTVLWKRPLRHMILAYIVVAVVVIPIMAIELGETNWWQALVSILLGGVWAGIYLGGVRIIGPLAWSKLQDSTLLQWFRFRTDDWSNPPPLD